MFPYACSYASVPPTIFRFSARSGKRTLECQIVWALRQEFVIHGATYSRLVSSILQTTRESFCQCVTCRARFDMPLFLVWMAVIVSSRTPVFVSSRYPEKSDHRLISAPTFCRELNVGCRIADCHVNGVSDIKPNSTKVATQ